MKQKEKIIPKIFISYSHDNSAHKQWVGEFGSKLVKNGIDVILDQWDMALGDDIPKFMEYGVSTADRVLMICTEPYVKKADDGKGGVGYEAMIVTGELVRDLGTSKFIPVIRQKSANAILPKSVSTRFYIDLSESQNFDEQFELLLRELHQEPVVTKPSLGKNPFSKQPSGLETPVEINSPKPIPDLSKSKQDVVSIYNTALDIARQGDLIAWRKIIQQIRQPIRQNIVAWRSRADSFQNLDDKAFHEFVLEGISIYAPLFSIALAGVESGREKFNNQISIIDDILYPKDWKWSGSTKIVNFPYSVAYVYQALHGAIGIFTGQLQISIKLATARFEQQFSSEKKPLFKFPEIIGWPESLGENSLLSWKMLLGLTDIWPWLNNIFGDAEDFQSSICAYYIALNILEFSFTVASPEGVEAIKKTDGIWPDIPPLFHDVDKDIKKRAYRLLINVPDQVREIWLPLNLKEEDLKSLWADWVKLVRQWLKSSNRFGFREDVPHRDLFIDIK